MSDHNSKWPTKTAMTGHSSHTFIFRTLGLVFGLTIAEGMRTGAREGGALRRGSPLTEGRGLLPPKGSGASLP